MARSGTTLAQHILGLQPGVHVEVEPHMLWKTGNFRYLADENNPVRRRACDRISKRLTDGLHGRTLVEKSPANSLRPELVHAVFPQALVIYMERDPVACIASNLMRSETCDSLRPSIIFRKYLRGAGSEDLAGAMGKRTLSQQLGTRDLVQFAGYTFRFLWLRQVCRTLPFGPKIEGFSELVRTRGLLNYHVEVFRRSQKHRHQFEELYGNQLKLFRLSDLHVSQESVRELLRFSGLDASAATAKRAMQTFSSERISASGHVSRRDEISEALNEIGLGEESSA
jgi:hypothetical protein